MNHFAGMLYEYVMVDSGCNSILLRFNEEALKLFGAD